MPPYEYSATGSLIPPLLHFALSFFLLHFDI